MSKLTLPSITSSMPLVQIRKPSDRRNVSRSATRALDTLELFGARRGPLRAVEVASALGLHPSTTNQLLKSMVDSGHLVFEARSKSYLPSARLVEFGQWLSTRFASGAQLNELIRLLSDLTGQIITLATPNDIFMQVVDLVVPKNRQEFRGLQISMFGSAVGGAYLSTLDQDEISRLAYRARVPESAWARIFNDANVARLKGFSTAESDSSNWSIALPLSISGLSAPKVIGMSGDPAALRDSPEAIARRMQDAIGHWLEEQNSR